MVEYTQTNQVMNYEEIEGLVKSRRITA